MPIYCAEYTNSNLQHLVYFVTEKQLLHKFMLASPDSLLHPCLCPPYLPSRCLRFLLLLVLKCPLKCCYCRQCLGGMILALNAQMP